MGAARRRSVLLPWRASSIIVQPPWCAVSPSPRLAVCPPAAVALSDLSWVRVRVGVVVLVVATVVVLRDADVHLRTAMSSNGDGGRLSYRMGFDRGWGDAATPVVRVQRF